MQHRKKVNNRNCGIRFRVPCPHSGLVKSGHKVSSPLILCYDGPRRLRSKLRHWIFSWRQQHCRAARCRVNCIQRAMRGLLNKIGLTLACSWSIRRRSTAVGAMVTHSLPEQCIQIIMLIFIIQNPSMQLRMRVYNMLLSSCGFHWLTRRDWPLPRRQQPLNYSMPVA